MFHSSTSTVLYPLALVFPVHRRLCRKEENEARRQKATRTSIHVCSSSFKISTVPLSNLVQRLAPRKEVGLEPSSRRLGQDGIQHAIFHHGAPLPFFKSSSFVQTPSATTTHTSTPPPHGARLWNRLFSLATSSSASRPRNPFPIPSTTQPRSPRLASLSTNDDGNRLLSKNGERQVRGLPIRSQTHGIQSPHSP